VKDQREDAEGERYQEEYGDEELLSECHRFESFSRPSRQLANPRFSSGETGLLGAPGGGDAATAGS